MPCAELVSVRHLLLWFNGSIPPLKGVLGMIIRDVEKAKFDFINHSDATALRIMCTTGSARSLPTRCPTRW